MLPIYLRSRRGTRARMSQAHYKSKKYTLVSAVSASKIIAPFIFEGSMDSKIFQTYVKKVLIPELKSGQVLIMDNLSSHKSQIVQQMLEESGIKLVFLPPYSPELNPIELAWSQLKNYLGKKKNMDEEKLIEAVRAGINM